MLAPAQLRALMLVALATSLAACSGATAPTSLAGVYTLRTIDGAPLPFSLGGYTIAGSMLTVTDGGTWTERITWLVMYGSGSQQQVTTGHGTYTRDGTHVDFQYDHTADPDYSPNRDYTAYTGTSTASTLVLTNAVGTHTFVR